MCSPLAMPARRTWRRRRAGASVAAVGRGTTAVFDEVENVVPHLHGSHVGMR